MRVTSHPDGGFSWVGLVTNDADDAKRFYAEVFGWEYDDLDVGDGMTFTIALQDDAQVAAIQAAPPGMPAPSAWNTYFTMRNAESSVEAARAAGASVFLGPLEVVSPDGEVIGGFALGLDPQGNAHCWWQPGRIIGSQRLGEPGTLAWTTLHTVDPDAAADYYGNVLPWRFTSSGDGVHVAELLSGQEPIAAVHGTEHGLSGWVPFFQVDDAAASRDRVVANGGAQRTPIATTATGAVVVVADRQGCVFGLLAGEPGGDLTTALRGSEFTEAAPTSFTATYNPFADDANDRYHEDWARMRAEGVGKNAIGAVMVSRFADVVAVATDEARFSSRTPFPSVVPEGVAHALPEGYAFEHPALINNDPPSHTRVRTLARSALAPRVVARREDEIRHLVTELLDDLEGRERVEFQHDYATPLPVAVISRLLGLTDLPVSLVKDWTEGAFALGRFGLDPDGRERLAREQVEMNRALGERIRERRTSPQDDLISLLVTAEEAGEEPLTDREVLAIVSQLLIAGNDTTTNLLGNLMVLLLEDRSRWDGIVADPSSIPAVIDEAARLAAPVPALVRTARQDTEIAGCPVSTGDLIVLGYGSANRDPRRFDAPDEWRPGREERHEAVSFGRGIHHCIGSPLAKLEIRVTLEELTRRFPDLDLAVPVSGLQRMPGLHFGWETVPIRLV